MTFIHFNIHRRILTSIGWKNANNIIAIRYEVCHLPLNDTTANVVHHDFDLYFQYHEKCSGMTLMEIGILHQNRTNANVVLHDLDLDF